jgi:predicted outer membrane protein
MADVRALLPLVAAAVAGTTLAGCGGGDDKSTTTTAVSRPLTHQQLVARGNQVCIDTDRAVQRLGHPSSREPSYWNKLIPLSEAALGEMAALKPPAKDKANFAKMMKLARQEVDAIKKIRDAIAKGKLEEAGRNLRIATALDTKVKFAARDVGFGFCSQLLSNWPA